MMITKLEEVKKTFLRVYLNEEAAFRITKRKAVDFNLEEGSKLDEEKWNQILQEVLIPDARRLCMDMLVRKDCSKKQLQDKCREKELPQEAIDQAIAYVENFHYLDDRRMAESYIRSHKETMGRNKLRFELEKRGISSQIIEELFEDFEEDEEKEAIRYWLEKKHFDMKDSSPEECRRIFAFLMRKGFSSAAIYSQMRQS